MEIKSNNILLIIILALVFGVGGGVFGEIIARVYLLQDAYNVPFFGNVNVPNNIYNGSSLIIDSPRKVFVEQNTKTLETVNSATKNIVGIFKTIKTDSSTSTIDVKKQYNLNLPLGQGSVVTSDGWIMSSFVPEELLDLKESKMDLSADLKNKILSNYTILTSDGMAYSLLDLNFSSNYNVSFWRINANDLGVKKFKKISEINRGQIAIAVNFRGQSWLSTISSKYSQDMPDVLSSDVTYSEFKFVNPVNEDFGDAFVYSIEGDLIGLIKNRTIKPLSSYFSCLNCLLEKKKLTTPFLGIKYINLFNYSGSNSKKTLGQGAMIYPDDKGVFIIKGSPAEKAGFKEGDIILAVNAEIISRDNQLSDVIQEMKPGEMANFKIERNGKEMQLSVVLDSR